VGHGGRGARAPHPTATFATGQRCDACEELRQPHHLARHGSNPATPPLPSPLTNDVTHARNAASHTTRLATTAKHPACASLGLSQSVPTFPSAIQYVGVCTIAKEAWAWRWRERDDGAMMSLH
jgi:hypothetical protein